jgi:hypothetical protein
MPGVTGRRAAGNPNRLTMAKIICEHCKKDIGSPDFECNARICPLDEFKLHCVIKANGSTTRKKRSNSTITNGLGGPAPSDSPKRILN